MTDIGVLKTRFGTVILDYHYGNVNVNLTDPGHDDIMSLWENYFKDMQDVTVLLSGGLDSQFSLFLASKFCRNVKALTFQYNWDDDIINASDLFLAQKLSKKLNVEHHIEEIDVKTFLNNELEDFARKYKSPSPQICVHLYGINNSKFNNGPLLMGGDVPYLGVFEGKILSSYKMYPGIDESIRRSTSDYFKSYIGPYEIYNELQNKNVLKDPFLLTPEIYYLATKQNLTVIKDKKIILDQSYANNRLNFERYKTEYYKTFNFEYLLPLKKRTGFENVKTHLASKTGVYNQFDLDYRFPLLDISAKEKWHGKLVPKNMPTSPNSMIKMHVVSDEIDSITEIAQKIYDKNDIEICNEYTFEDL